MQISVCGEPHGATELYALDVDGNVWALGYRGGEPQWTFVGSPNAAKE